MEDTPMSDQPKVIPDPIEPQPVQWGRMQMTPGRKKAVAVLVTIIFCWAAYAGHILAGVLLFPVFILWNWAVPGLQTDRGAWRPRRDPGDSWGLGSTTGVATGSDGLAGRADYLRKEWTDEQGRREQERRMR